MPAGPGGNDARGVWQFGESDTQALASDLLNLGQASTSTQFGVDRSRMTTIETNVAASAQRRIVPTSVEGSGVTVDASGLVTLTAATSASLNGVFTSTYSRYVIHYDFPTTSTNLTFTARLRASGDDNSSAVYDQHRNIARGSDAASPASANQLALTSWAFGTNAGTRLHFGSFEIARPATATPTLAIGQSWATLNPATAATTTGIIQFGGLHRSSTAFDGISIICSTGNATGTIKVYAYN